MGADDYEQRARDWLCDHDGNFHDHGCDCGVCGPKARALAALLAEVAGEGRANILQQRIDAHQDCYQYGKVDS